MCVFRNMHVAFNTKLSLYIIISTQKDKERSMSSVDSVGVVFQKYEETNVSARWCLLALRS